MKLKLFYSIIFICILLQFPLIIFCDYYKDDGKKHFQNFTDNDYNRQPQNYCTIQDERGIIYVANNNGVLEFDGVSWRCIEVPNKSVRSLAIDASGKIYLGGLNEFGYLAPDSQGSLQFKSLMDHIAEKIRSFDKVFKIHATKYGIFFYTKNYIFRWYKGKIKHWETNSDNRFYGAFLCHDQYFVQVKNKGLMRIDNDSMKLVPQGKTFASERIFMMVPYNEYEILIGTRSKGFYLKSSQYIKTFPMGMNRYLEGKQLYYGTCLSSGDFALATHQGGLVIMDPNGKLKKVFDTELGLPVNDVKHVLEDRQGNLWLALNKGITKIEYFSPISLYDAQSNLRDISLSVTRHHNKLYLGLFRNLYSLSPNHKFHIAYEIESPCWSILSINNSILVATTKGVFEIDSKRNKKTKLIERKSWVLIQSTKDKNRIWVGKTNGLLSLYHEHDNRGWDIEWELEKEGIEIDTIVEDKLGNLWGGHPNRGVTRIVFSNNNPPNNPTVTFYNKSHGLPEMPIRVFKIKDRATFATDEGLYRFDEEKQSFVPDLILGKDFAGGDNGNPVFRLAEDYDRDIWLHSDRRNIWAISKPDGTFDINPKPFLRIPPGQANAIYPDPDGNTIWFATHDGLLGFNKRINKDYDLDFKTILRKVLANKKIQFDGFKYEKKNNPKYSPKVAAIKYEDRNLRFIFSAPFFEAEPETNYHWQLEGYDEKWSEWSSETQIDYTNLWEGQYTFRVQAKNVYGTLGSEDIFKFKILPPWYRSWWAYLLYGATAIFIVFLIIKWRSRQLLQEQKRLETIIHQRTQKIEDQKHQLEIQSQKLADLDKMKSLFFANISHEFRTPLTLLMGPLEQMITGCENEEKEKKRKLTLMLRNAQRLLRLINQLLELSKLESGKMKLQTTKTNIIPFIKGITDSFTVMAQQKELELTFIPETNSDTGEPWLFIDTRKMEDIMSNLLVNAIKFTPPGGEVHVTIKTNQEPEPGFPEGWTEIEVSDTGPGIPDDQLSHIFDRFYQAEATLEYHEKGSGIGLALCKELVELHHGTITAHSSRGDGSCFTVRLPIGKSLLKPDEIVEGSRADKEEKNSKAHQVPTLDVIEDNGDTGEFEVSEEVFENLGDEKKSKTEKNIILVVEDSADMREYIGSALTADYTVVEAVNGKEGIEKAQAMIPDLVVSDVMMPEADGYELCRTLKQDVRTSHIPVILLTAKAGEENIVEGLETGADDYITKPFSTRVLCARIKNLIDIRAHLQQNVRREMTMQPVKISVSKIDDQFLRELQGVIGKNISEPDFNVEALCRKMVMSNTTLYRKIQALCGRTPTEFIRDCRLKRAVQLLKRGYGSVTEVAFEVGFSSRTYFTKCFKEEFHRLPSEFVEKRKSQ